MEWRALSCPQKSDVWVMRGGKVCLWASAGITGGALIINALSN